MSFPIPADIPRDGSVAYDGRHIVTTTGSRLGLVGCVMPRSGSSGHYVIHRWDGSALGAGRALSEDIGCSGPRPTMLTDGTWAFEARSDFVVIQP